MAKKKVVITTNKELYQKLNMLLYSSDVVVRGIQKQDITRILNNINKKENIIDVEKIGEYFLLKKVAPINFNVYYREKR